MFSGDESASFLALVESIRSELDLVQGNLASNVTLAEEHAAHAHEHLDEHTIEEIEERNERLATDLPAALEDLHHSVANSTAQQVQTKIQNINDLLGETVTVRIDSEQLNNSTVWALVIANMADGVVGHYGAAYGIETEEGEEHGRDEHDEESGEHNESGNMTHDDDMTTETSSEHDGGMSEGSTTIVDMVHYQSALGLANRMQLLFIDQVKELAPVGSAEFVADLEAGLEHLKQAVENEEPFMDVEVILHSEVHPNLQSAFNLELAGQTDSPGEFMEEVTLDGNTYHVAGKSSNVNITAVRIDSGQAVKVDFEGSGDVELTLPKTMIEGINMIQTTEGQAVNYTLDETDSTTTIIFTVEEGVSSVDIMGAMVVPEFPVIAAILAATIAGIVGYTRVTRSGTPGFFEKD